MSTSVAEKIIADVFALLPNGTKTAVGERERNAHMGRPLVIAVPRGAPVIQQPTKIGGYYDSNGDGRALYERLFVIEWDCHNIRDGAEAQDFGEAEVLYLQTLRAIRKVCHHSVEFSDEEWLDQREGGDGFSVFGCTIRFRSTIRLPIYEPQGQVVTLTANPPIVTTAKLNGNTET